MNYILNSFVDVKNCTITGTCSSSLLPELECEQPNRFCDNSTKCLKVSQLCDNKTDCQDGTDEGLRCGLYIFVN